MVVERSPGCCCRGAEGTALCIPQATTPRGDRGVTVSTSTCTVCDNKSFSQPPECLCASCPFLTSLAISSKHSRVRAALFGELGSDRVWELAGTSSDYVDWILSNLILIVYSFDCNFDMSAKCCSYSESFVI